ncbi:MAG: NAD-dependent epimerase/dehydratase family protein, partial [Chloroflexi bacterium]|nr:NAD-dependent epimerase/dehydratase family protein [Chloroflexota bacterium]
MARLLVTGASGLLGFAVVRTALAEGWTVSAAVRSHTAELLAALRQPVDVWEQDLADATGLGALITATAPDAVIHTA